MRSFEKVVHERRGAPGNSYIVTLFWDSEDGELKVREYKTARRRETRVIHSLSAYLKLKNARWPDMYKVPQGRVHSALLAIMVKSGAQPVEDRDAHRT